MVFFRKGGGVVNMTTTALWLRPLRSLVAARLKNRQPRLEHDATYLVDFGGIFHILDNPMGSEQSWIEYVLYRSCIFERKS